MTVTMTNIQAQLKTLATAQTNHTMSKRKHYFWSSGSQLHSWEKNLPSNKLVHQDESYYKKILVGSEKGCEWWLGAIFNKVEIINPKISLLNYIDTSPNPTSNKILAIVDSGVNIHLSKQATPTMAPAIIENDMKARLPYGSTMESSHKTTVHLPGLSKLVRQIHIFPKIQTSPSISLGILYDDRCTITLEKNVNQEEWKINNQRHHKQKDWNVGSVSGETTIRRCGKQYSGKNFKTRTIPVFICIIFHPNYSKSNQGNQTWFSEEMAGSHRKIIKNHLEKSSNTPMGHLHVRRKGLQ